MARRIQCPECDERVILPAQPEGKRIVCSECGHKFRLPDEEDEDDQPVRRSSRRREPEEEDEDERPRKSKRSGSKKKRAGRSTSIPVAVWIGGGVAAFLLIGVGLVFGLRSGKKGADQENADETAKKNDPLPGLLPGQAPRAKTDPDEDRAQAAGWTVTVDLSGRKVDFAAQTQTMAVPLDIGASLYLPSTASPFFASGGVSRPTDALTVYDTRTKQPVGAIRGKTDLQPPVALSPDGKFIAGQSGFKSVIDVYDFSTGKGTRTFDPKTLQIQAVDFGADDEVVVVCSAPNLTEKVLQTWSLTSGTMTRSITLPKQTIGQPFMALSPGRHLAAVAAGNNVWVYRLADGKLLGARPIPKLADKNNYTEYTTCDGLAFSLDGTELAALLRTSQRTQIAAWNVATGKLEQNHEVTDTLGNWVGASHTNNLEYLPDGRAWLIHSNFVIDRQSGSTLLQFHPLNQSRMSKLRILPNDLVVMVSDGQAGKKSAITTPFDRAAYDAAAQAARGAGSGAAAKVGDRSGVKPIAAAGNPTWAVTADPVIAGKPFAASIPLKTPGQVVHGVAAGSPESAQFATVSIVEVKTPFLRKVARWDRYDFSNGQSLGAVELGTVKNVSFGTPIEAALSPNGERIAVRSIAEPNRVDVWSSDGKPLGGFLAAASGTPVNWLGFLAVDKLLTMTGNQVTLWDVPAFKAVYETGPNYRGLPALSGNRQWLAVCNGAGFDVLEATTGVSRGRIAAGGNSDPKQNIYATAAFTLDGTKLAGVVASPTGGGRLVVCDLASGQIAQIVQTASPGGRLQWCGVNHLLQDSNLVDLQTKMVVWNYTLRGASVRELIDERYWHVEAGPGNTVPGKLVASTLPDEPVSKVLASVQQPGTQILVGPGAAVSIQMNMPGEGDPNFAKDLTARLTQNLERKGLVVRADAPVTLSVTSSVELSGEMYELQAFGGSTAKRTIPLKKLNVGMSLTDKSGRIIWHEKRTFAQGGSRFFQGNEDPEKILATEMWSAGAGWVSSPQLTASHVYIVGGNLVTLPGNSAMVPDR